MSDLRAAITAKEYYDHDRTGILRHLASPPTAILEVGCASGHLLAYLTGQGAKQVVGIEMVPEIAARARSRLPDALILTGLFEEIDDVEIGTGFDLVIISFVLEHVADPWKVIRRLMQLLRPGGQVIGALPNVRHWSITGPLLLCGRFDYVEEGILDRTHLRFFTRKSIFDMLTSSGLHDVRIDPVIHGPRSRIANALTFGLAPDHFAFAFEFSGCVKD